MQICAFHRSRARMSLLSAAHVLGAAGAQSLCGMGALLSVYASAVFSFLNSQASIALRLPFALARAGIVIDS